MKPLIIVIISIVLGTILPAQKPKLVYVAAGSFEMGSLNTAYPDESPIHNVTVDSFYISKYEVLYEDYIAFCRFAGTAEPVGETGFPATNVTWENAVMFCNWLSGMEGWEQCYTFSREKDKFKVTCDFSKNGYRLPTEAEWEFAARGGVRNKGFKYSGSNDPFKTTFFSENSKGVSQKSGQMLPNELGLYDMSGNVAEWCWDFYDKDYFKASPPLKPLGPGTGTTRVYKGGSRKNKIEFVEISRRFALEPEQKDLYVGFRVVRTRLN